MLDHINLEIERSIHQCGDRTIIRAGVDGDVKYGRKMRSGIVIRFGEIYSLFFARHLFRIIG